MWRELSSEALKRGRRHVDVEGRLRSAQVSFELGRVDEQKLIKLTLLLQKDFVAGEAGLDENVVFGQSVLLAHTAFGFPREKVVLSRLRLPRFILLFCHE